MLFSDDREPAPFYERHMLAPGARITGPALITEYSSTTLIDRGFVGQIDPMGNLLLETEEDTASVDDHALIAGE